MIINIFKKKLSGLLLITALATSAQAHGNLAAKDSLVNYVDPFIGTGYHGHVFLGANVPLSAVQLGRKMQRTAGTDEAAIIIRVIISLGFRIRT
ncbi:hypothetical protein [Mucilaginibacter sp.]